MRAAVLNVWNRNLRQKTTIFECQAVGDERKTQCVLCIIRRYLLERRDLRPTEKRFLYLFCLTLARRELAKIKKRVCVLLDGRAKYKIARARALHAIKILRGSHSYLQKKKAFYIKRNCYRAHTHNNRRGSKT